MIDQVIWLNRLKMASRIGNISSPFSFFSFENPLWLLLLSANLQLAMDSLIDS